MIIVLHTSCLPRDEEMFQTGLDKLPEQERSRISRLHRPQDRCARLAGRLLAYEGARRFMNLPDPPPSLTVDEQGRPKLDNGPDLNLSHNGTCAVCVVASSGRVGVDVESVNTPIPAGFTVILTHEERRAVFSTNEARRAFAGLWTCKESVLKADGRGPRLPLKAVRIDGTTAVVEDTEWHVREIGVGKGLVCHVAADRPLTGLRVEHIPFDRLARKNAH